MSKVLAWLRGLVGNKWKEALAIFAFIALLCLVMCQPVHSAEIDLRAGTSVGHGGMGPVLGINALFPQGNGLSLYAGTLLWGATSELPNNWSWEGGLRGCRWAICLSIGASYWQRTDLRIGSHTNFNLAFSWMLPFKRFRSIDVDHFSDAGTTPVNKGANAVLGAFRLQ